MLHALALAAALGSAAPAAASPTMAFMTQRPPESACTASIDPSFVRYVPPPTRASGGNPLLWWISSAPEPPGVRVLRFGPRPRPDCLRTLQVHSTR
jgi:hypothetical protein